MSRRHTTVLIPVPNGEYIDYHVRCSCMWTSVSARPLSAAQSDADSHVEWGNFIEQDRP